MGRKRPVQITVTLKPETLDLLNRLAAGYRTSRGSWVRNVLEEATPMLEELAALPGREEGEVISALRRMLNRAREDAEVAARQLPWKDYEQ